MLISCIQVVTKRFHYISTCHGVPHGVVFVTDEHQFDGGTTLLYPVFARSCVCASKIIKIYINNNNCSKVLLISVTSNVDFNSAHWTNPMVDEKKTHNLNSIYSGLADACCVFIAKTQKKCFCFRLRTV